MWLKYTGFYLRFEKIYCINPRRGVEASRIETNVKKWLNVFLRVSPLFLFQDEFILNLHPCNYLYTLFQNLMNTTLICYERVT